VVSFVERWCASKPLAFSFSCRFTMTRLVGRLFAVHQHAKTEAARVTKLNRLTTMTPTVAGVERPELDDGGASVGGGGAELLPLVLFARSPLTNTTRTALYLKREGYYVSVSCRRLSPLKCNVRCCGGENVLSPRIGERAQRAGKDDNKEAQDKQPPAWVCFQIESKDGTKEESGREDDRHGGDYRRDGTMRYVIDITFAS
jgi:hypothetical protein